MKLIVDIIEPFKGRILDPASGSGGMFVQSARFVEEHQRNPTSEISIFGKERVEETIRLAKMNLAVHGLSGDIVPSKPTTRIPIGHSGSSTSSLPIRHST